MSLDTAKRTLSIVSLALEAIDAINRAAKGVVLSNHTADSLGSIIGAIAAVTDTVTKALEGSATADDIEADLRELRGAIAANDKAAQDSVDLKFPQ